MPRWLDDAKATAAAKTAKTLADSAWAAAQKEIDGLLSPLEEELARRQQAAAPAPVPAHGAAPGAAQGPEPAPAPAPEAELDRAIAHADELARMKAAAVPRDPVDPFAAAEAALARAREARQSVGRSRQDAAREESARAQLAALKGAPPAAPASDEDPPAPTAPARRRL